MDLDRQQPLLVIENLHVAVGGSEVLRGINLSINEGETHVLLGPNGGGKTTLLNTIVGLPGYRITQGSITFKGTDLADLEIDERARLGIGVAFQRPPAVRGIKLRQLIEVAAGEGDHEVLLADLIGDLSLLKMVDRDVNMGFSGGEMKRSEMAQLIAQAPELTLFDEPESGVDLDNIAVVGKAMNRLLKAERVGKGTRAGLIVTHTGHILEYVNADIGHVLYNGKLACKGNPLDLIGEIGKHGYGKCVECAICQM
ncbi:MAG: ABC transporter ATP-binding protein [Coriobacteriia bacterium]|nr:ABC transporter ATP-binding protein [Coriobacteriia bacterium]